MNNPLKKAAYISEQVLKEIFFDCRNCGQCLLTQTGYVCPMRCPKTLRNGPCGGPNDGKCEVYEDRPCIWLKIHKNKKRLGRDKGPEPMKPPINDELRQTSSYINYFTKADLPGRIPIPYMDIDFEAARKTVFTDSLLEKRLKDGKFVYTCEIRSPRGTGQKKITKESKVLKGWVEAINATANLNGKPSLSSTRVCEVIKEHDGEGITQITARDINRTTFVAGLVSAGFGGVKNVLCLTGDFYKGSPRMRQNFEMDSSQMIFEARHIRDKGSSFFFDQKIKKAPKLFIGAAASPFTEPLYVPVKRLEQKVLAGVDFVQTQLVADIPRFKKWLDLVKDAGLHEKVFMIVGLPVIASKTVIPVLTSVPGVHIPEEILKRIDQSKDPAEEGIKVTKELIEELKEMEGVNGVHLMLFGGKNDLVPEIIERKIEER